MRENRGKRIFTGALILCLALLCALCWNGIRRVDATGASPALENETLSLRLGDDGLVQIDGEGALSAQDLDVLMNVNQVKARQVNDLILSDGITELGYNAVNGYGYLNTLKLGSGISVVENGAVRNCAALEYVFVPRGVKRLGRDFLYRCDRAVVVTDGEKKDLPKMKSVPSERVLTLVDSCDALIEKRAALASEEVGQEIAQVPEACRLWWR